MTYLFDAKFKREEECGWRNCFQEIVDEEKLTFHPLQVLPPPLTPHTFIHPLPLYILHHSSSYSIKQKKPFIILCCYVSLIRSTYIHL